MFLLKYPHYQKLLPKLRQKWLLSKMVPFIRTITVNYLLRMRAEYISLHFYIFSKEKFDQKGWVGIQLRKTQCWSHKDDQGAFNQRNRGVGVTLGVVIYHIHYNSNSESNFDIKQRIWNFWIACHVYRCCLANARIWQVGSTKLPNLFFNKVDVADCEWALL